MTVSLEKEIKILIQLHIINKFLTVSLEKEREIFIQLHISRNTFKIYKLIYILNTAVLTRVKKDFYEAPEIKTNSGWPPDLENEIPGDIQKRFQNFSRR